jgi:adenine-specific DNA-methyltransferase
MMGEGLNRRSAAEETAAPAVSALVDRDLARSLSAVLAEHHRLAFAQSFTYAVLRACWQACDLSPRLSPPETVELVALSADAIAAAERIGVAVTQLEPKRAAYVVGTVYTTALPEAYRAAHGIFYTPPELVEQLLAMAEEGGCRLGIFTRA